MNRRNIRALPGTTCRQRQLLYLRDGEDIIGAVVRTRAEVNPLFVSVGHSFLGLGISPPIPDWGLIRRQHFKTIRMHMQYQMAVFTVDGDEILGFGQVMRKPVAGCLRKPYKKTYRRLVNPSGELVPAVKDVRFSLKQGEALGIVGESGSCAEPALPPCGSETVEFDHRQSFDKKVTEAQFKRAVGHLQTAGFEKKQSSEVAAKTCETYSYYGIILLE